MNDFRKAVAQVVAFFWTGLVGILVVLVAMGLALGPVALICFTVYQVAKLFSK